ncbi:TadE/TadG family type IV pilus assembly protein [Vibrio tetraodonis]|uniref:TadE/TadG family type IV pilus assembly protein n=1 Tax=Vibrio tetraodonis TaxID=2231647 RepID=UPI000E0B5996|nr:TadE family protein [Vibrio tetraodonis]
MKYNVRQTGFAAVEMAMVTPFMLLLVGGIIEISQFFQANSILTGVTREGANLVSRTSATAPDDIMNLVSRTTGSLDLSEDGVMYITLVTGQEDDAPYVSEQYRWSGSGLDHTSSAWGQCSSWTNHQCNIDSPLPTLSDFPISLSPNESVYVVEVHYQYSPLSSLFIKSGFVVSDITYL